jgi:biopolymer transport protein ExbB
MTTANAQDVGSARSMADLLKLIEQGQLRDSQEARTREQAFKAAQNSQQSLLNQARAERTRQEAVSAGLEQNFEENQQRIITARQALDERLGALKELFGVLQTVSGDTQSVFNGSLTNIQKPERCPRKSLSQDGL